MVINHSLIGMILQVPLNYHEEIHPPKVNNVLRCTCKRLTPRRWSKLKGLPLSVLMLLKMEKNTNNPLRPWCFWRDHPKSRKQILVQKPLREQMGTCFLWFVGPLGEDDPTRSKTTVTKGDQLVQLLQNWQQMNELQLLDAWEIPQWSPTGMY